MHFTVKYKYGNCYCKRISRFIEKMTVEFDPMYIYCALIAAYRLPGIVLQESTSQNYRFEERPAGYIESRCNIHFHLSLS